MPLMNTYGDRALTLVRGQGCELWDDQGKPYLDALSGIAVCGLGHCHPAVTSAIHQQSSQLLHVSNLYNVLPQQQAATKLQQLSGMDKIFFSNSGAEANEAAIKIARKFGNDRGIINPTIITMTNSFHGRTMATLSATGNQKVKKGFTPLLSGFVEVPFNDLAAIETCKTDTDIVAIMVEPIQGEGGIQIPDEGYLSGLRNICDQQGWLLIFDEIQTGNGRTGRYFAHQHYDLLPDVLTTAKGLGNGMPIGACMARSEAACVLQPGNHGSTYGGNPVACASALAVMKTIDDQNLCAHAASLGEYFIEGFKHALKDKSSVVDIRGKGLMMGISLNRDCPEIVAKAADSGLLINVTAGNVIRLLPPLIMSTDEACQVIARLSPLID